jgi:hypothetical protein
VPIWSRNHVGRLAEYEHDLVRIANGNVSPAECMPIADAENAWWSMSLRRGVAPDASMAVAHPGRLRHADRGGVREAELAGSAASSAPARSR